MILERLFGESSIKLGELHRYTFELVDAFVNNAAVAVQNNRYGRITGLPPELLELSPFRQHL